MTKATPEFKAKSKAMAVNIMLTVVAPNVRPIYDGLFMFYSGRTDIIAKPAEIIVLEFKPDFTDCRFIKVQPYKGREVTENPNNVCFFVGRKGTLTHITKPPSSQEIHDTFWGSVEDQMQTSVVNTFKTIAEQNPVKAKEGLLGLHSALPGMVRKIKSKTLDNQTITKVKE